MSKCIIVGDLHIHDYTDYNLKEPNWRLNQFIKLSKRIIEVAKTKNCDIVIYAGDLIHRPILSSKTAYVVDKFFKMQYEAGLTIYYILGQHDLQTKSNIQNHDDSIIPVLLDHYATYMDKKIITIDGKTVAFSNWRPQQDFSFIPDKVDVLIGHLTLSEKFGQEYDDSKYKIGFFGDIHKRKSIKNSHTTNVPIPHYISDDQNGSVIVLDFETLKWERVNTETEQTKFLKIMYDDNSSYDVSHPYTILVEKPKVIVEDEVKILVGLDIENVIFESVKAVNLTELHKKLSTEVSRNFVPIDLNFTLENIKIHNFKSIKDLDFNFSFGITAITGENGSGKSSFMRAIEFALRPPRATSHLVMKFQKEMELSLSLIYQNNRHVITRGYKNGANWVRYEINGVEEQGNNQSEINEKIKSNLPFIKFFNLLYRAQGVSYLLSDYGYEDRINIISEILGLGIIQEYHSLVKSKISKLSEDIKELNSNLSNMKAIKDNLKSQLAEKQEKYGGCSISSLQNQLDSNNSEKEKIKKLIHDIELRDTLVMQIDSCNEIISSLEPNYSSYESYDISQIDSAIQNSQNIIKNLESEISDLKSDLQQPEFKIQLLKSSLNESKTQLSELKDVCPTCKKPLDNDQVKSSLELQIFQTTNFIETEKQNYEKLKNSINHKIEKLNADIEAERDKYEELKHVKFNYQNNRDIGSKLVSAKVRINSLSQELELYPESLNKYSVSKLENRLKELDSINSTLIYKLSELKFIKEQVSNYLELDKKFNQANEVVLENNLVLDEYTKYQNLFAPSGVIVQSVFTKVSEIMTENKFIVRTVKYLKSGEPRIDFNIDLKVGELLIPYEELSGGQKVLTDIFFLSKLFQLGTRAGALILDESLKDLSEDKLEDVTKILKNSKINTILLSTHVQSFNFYDFKINSTLVNNVSNYTFEGN